MTETTKTFVCLTSVILLLMGVFALPCFGATTPYQVVYIYTPIMNYHPNSGVTVTGWDEHVMEFSSLASSESEILDLQIDIIVSIVANSESYKATTKVSVHWDLRDDEYYAHTETYELPTEDNPQRVITGYKMGENRPINEIPVLSDNTTTDMTQYTYKLAVLPYTLDNSKAYWIKVYLVNPEFNYAINQQTATDQEIIEETLNDAGVWLEMGQYEMWSGLWNQLGGIDIDILLRRGYEIIDFAWNNTPDYITSAIVSICAMGLVIKVVGMIL